MSTTIYHSDTSTHDQRMSKHSVVQRFIKWCEGQQQDRLFWHGLAFAGHGWLVTPFTIMIIYFFNGPATLLYFALLVMTITLIVNLQSSSTKVTIPVFMISLFLDLILIITSIILY